MLKWSKLPVIIIIITLITIIILIHRVHKQPQLIYQVGHKSSSAATQTVKGKSLKMDLE